MVWDLTNVFDDKVNSKRISTGVHSKIRQNYIHFMITDVIGIGGNVMQN